MRVKRTVVPQQPLIGVVLLSDKVEMSGRLVSTIVRMRNFPFKNTKRCSPCVLHSDRLCRRRHFVYAISAKLVLKSEASGHGGRPATLMSDVLQSEYEEPMAVRDKCPCRDARVDESFERSI